MDKCPQCGYVEKPKANNAHTIMNHYFGSNGVDGFMNRTEETFKTMGKDDVEVVWTRKDVKEKADAAKAPAPKTPTTPTK